MTLLSSVFLLHRMADQGEAPSLFEHITSNDFPLSTVLQLCADDGQRSLFSAARAHSRLHQVVTARSSIKATIGTNEQMDSMLLYASKYGQNVDSLFVRGIDRTEVSIRQLPSDLRLRSLQLRNVGVQLQQGYGFQGILGAAAGIAALKQLRLRDCELLDVGTPARMEAALGLLPTGLEHLSINKLSLYEEDSEFFGAASFPSEALQPLQQLTHLELAGLEVYGPQDTWQPLQALTLLADLRLSNMHRITASALSQAHRLTRLQLLADEECTYDVEPGVLAGKAMLQHLEMPSCITLGGAAGEDQLLSHLQHMQQLTHLDLMGSLRAVEENQPHAAAAAYAALTASSKLHTLN